jgi:hypothetical protein
MCRALLASWDAAVYSTIAVSATQIRAKHPLIQALPKPGRTPGAFPLRWLFKRTRQSGALRHELRAGGQWALY